MVRSIRYFVILSFLYSCSNPKTLQYLQGSFDTTALARLELPETTIQKGDLITIAVFSDNLSSAKPFNQEPSTTSLQTPNAGELMGASAQNTPALTPGYLVDISGNIMFPVIGALKVEGLTKSELVTLLNERLSRYLSKPYYNIRFVNFRITMIGEVARPGVYSIPNERVNIFEAIGLAGDLTFFGKRENVLIVRESNGKREFGRIDLRDPNLFRSPYYYLRQNDMVLIDISKRKIAASDQTAFRNISLAATIVSAIAVLVSVLRR